MRCRRVLALPVLLSALTGCGASATPAGPSSGGGLSGTLHGRVVDGLTATGLGGIRVSGGLQNVLSEASGDFALNPAFETEQGGLYTFSGSAIVERNTGQCPDHALRLAIELQNAESQHKRMAARIEMLEQSTSFRITKPLRALNRARRRISRR